MANFEHVIAGWEVALFSLEEPKFKRQGQQNKVQKGHSIITFALKGKVGVGFYQNENVC